MYTYTYIYIRWRVGTLYAARRRRIDMRIVLPPGWPLFATAPVRPPPTRRTAAAAAAAAPCFGVYSVRTPLISQINDLGVCNHRRHRRRRLYDSTYIIIIRIHIRRRREKRVWTRIYCRYTHNDRPSDGYLRRGPNPVYYIYTHTHTHTHVWVPYMYTPRRNRIFERERMRQRSYTHTTRGLQYINNVCFFFYPNDRCSRV